MPSILIPLLEIPIPVGLIVAIVVSGGLFLLVIIFNMVSSAISSNGTQQRAHTAEQQIEAGRLLNTALIDIAAIMIMADGKVKEVELDRAVEIGRKFSTSFSESKLREKCTKILPNQSAKKTMKELKKILTDTQLKSVLAFMIEIAKADGDIDVAEFSVVAMAAQEWEIEI